MMTVKKVAAEACDQNDSDGIEGGWAAETDLATLSGVVMIMLKTWTRAQDAPGAECENR